MPDDIGRYTLGEMRERVLRRLDAYQAETVDPNTGEETGTPLLSPRYSKPDINMAINTSVTQYYTDIIAASDYPFADEERVDIKKDLVEYRLPTDMALLRGLWWKDPSDSLEVVPPSERRFMWQDEELDTVIDGWRGGAPTYRRQMNFFVLNWKPTEDNDGGVLVRYVKWALHLVHDDEFLETEFARSLQEVVILDAAIQLREQRGGLISQEMKDERARYELRLSTLVTQSSQPPVAHLITRHPLADTKFYVSGGKK